MANIICPWCFEKFRDIELQFRCIDPTCKLVKDKLYAKYHSMSTPPLMQQTLDPDEGFLANKLGLEMDETACTECGTETNKKICPRCHNELPDSIGKYTHYNFAIVGSKESGKSHFIAVLLNCLRHEVGEKLDASLLPLNDETIKRYNREFYDPIFRDRIVLDATRSASTHKGTKAPMIFCLKIRKKGTFGDRFEVINLVFFDTAGEDLDHVDLLQLDAKYIGQADGIIYLMDPLQANVFRELAAGVVLPDENTDPGLVIHNIARTIRRTQNIALDKRIKTPLAFTVSKFDAVLSTLPKSSAMFDTCSHGDKFDQDCFKRLDTEIRALMRQWLGDSGSTVREVDHNFSTTGFFAVSALGASPDASGNLKLGVTPYRIADPLLWLLWKWGIIDNVKIK